jgi:competence protein ComEC
VTRSAGRVWCAAAALVCGTVHGCGPGRAGPVVVGMAVAGGGMAALCRPRVVRVVGMAALACALGSWGAEPRCQPASAVRELARRTPECSFHGRVLEGAGGLGTVVAIEDLRCDGFAPVSDAGIAILDGAVGEAGAALAGRGLLAPLGDEGFDRARSLIGAHAHLVADDLEVERPGGLHAVAAAVRRGMRASTGTLDERRAGLLRGLAIGDVSAIDRRTEDALRRAGLAHLLAVSGSNVAIVLAAVGAVTGWLSARLRTAGAALALALYVLVVGPDPSVLRAAAMGGIGVAALAFGSRAEPLQALGLALIVLIALRPGLVFAIGLHLSVAATAGIVVWGPPLAHRLSRRLPRPAALGLAATLGAQAAVAPLLVAAFEELSLAGPVANALALPAVPPATVFSLAGAVAASFYPPAGEVMATIAEPFAAWILWVGDLWSDAPWAAATVPAWIAWPLGAAAATAAVMTLSRPQFSVQLAANGAAKCTEKEV